MAVNAGGLYVDLNLDSGSFQAGLKKASQQFDSFSSRTETGSRRLTSAFAGMGRGLSVALGAAGIGGLGLAAVVDQIKGAVSEISNLNAEAKRAGVAVEPFQELSYAAGQSRVAIDALVDGLKELQLRADEFVVTGKGSAAEAFQRLGYSAEELKAQLKDPLALLQDIIRRLYDLDKAAQIRVADEVFGGTAGEQFVRFIDLGRNGIANMRKEARDLGTVLDEGMVKQAAEIDRRFQALSVTIDTQVKGAILGLIDALREFSTSFQASIKVVADSPRDAMAKVQAEISGIQAQIDQQRRISNYAAIGDLEARLKDAERRRDALAESVREINRGLAATGGGASLPADGAPLPPTRPQGLGGSGAVTTGATSSAASVVDGYKQLSEAAQRRVADLRIEQAALGMTTQAAAAYRMEQELLLDAQRQGIDLSPQQRAEIHAVAEEYGKATQAVEGTRNAQEQLNQVRDLTSGFFKDVTGAMINGTSATEAFSDALKRLASRLLDMLADKAIMDLINSLSSLSTTGGGSIGLYAGGGSVTAASGGQIRGPGSGTSDSIPAMLSKGEFVVRASMAKKYGALLEGINAGRLRLPAFATGGAVGITRAAPVNVSTPATQVVFNGAPAGTRVEERDNGQGGRRVDVFFDEQVASTMRKTGSATQRAMGGYGVAPSLVRR